MTDEEMAEEYATKECCATCKNINHSCKEKCECWIFAKQGFLAGLKAGRPQWHKVADGDLPKESGKYLVWVGGVNGIFVLDFETEYNDFGYWCLQVGENLGVTDTIFETVTERDEDKVIAWCEVPTFDKE